MDCSTNESFVLCDLTARRHDTRGPRPPVLPPPPPLLLLLLLLLHRSRCMSPPSVSCLSPAFTPRTVNCRRGVSVSEPQRRVLNRRVARACCKSASRYSPCLTHLVWPHASQKTHRGGLGLGGSVHEEAHPCFPCFIQPSFKSIDAGSIYHPLVQLIPSSNHSVCLKKIQQSRVHRNLTSFPECPLIPHVLSARVKKTHWLTAAPSDSSHR